MKNFLFDFYRAWKRFWITIAINRVAREIVETQELLDYLETVEVSAVQRVERNAEIAHEREKLADLLEEQDYLRYKEIELS